MYNAKPEDRISAEELRTKLKLKTRLQWLDHPQRMEVIAWSSKCRSFKVSASFPRGRCRKIWNEE